MGKVTAKTIRRQRVMNDFVQAAREILDSQGLEGVSARKVAERAGWSYATIYNYFSDINNLLWHCIPAYIADINTLLLQEIQTEPRGNQQLIKSLKAYARYFLERPQLYRFMFLADIGPPPVELADKLSEPVLARGQEQILTLCAQQGTIAQEDIPIIGELISCAVNGALYMQGTGKFPISAEELEGRIEKYVQHILGERRTESEKR